MNSPVPAHEMQSPAMAPSWAVLAKTSLAAVWLIGFCVCFYQFDLPNSNPRVNRQTVWQQLPSLLVNLVDAPEPAANDVEARQLWRHAGWSFLPQRFPLYGTCLVILLGAWGWGNLLLRVLGLPIDVWTCERTFYSLTAGLGVVSLLTLGCGLWGHLSRGVLGGVLATGLVLELLARLFTFDSRHLERLQSGFAVLNPRRGWPLLCFVPFVLCFIGGAFLPETDFDVKEYHFGGPKEWFLAGRIEFLPHNVYTSFPFLTEMLTLLGMVLHGDWYWGAVAGKGVLMSFAPLTALGLFVAGRRWFSPRVGWWAAFIHLSTPWIYRISIIAYAEGGLTLYLLAALLALWFIPESLQSRTDNDDEEDVERDFSRRWMFLAGFLAGSAMACKYTGFVSVVIPLGVALILRETRFARFWKEASPSKDGDTATPELSFRNRVWRALIPYLIGTTVAVGPWLLKNVWDTGNPVYPLGYRVFSGRDWNAELNAKWQRAHSPDTYALSDLAIKLIDVTLKSDWQSPLLFGLAPLALLSGRLYRRRVLILWGFVLYLFGTWWLLTHRIDRFWVPMIPVVSLLAGIGAGQESSRPWCWLIGCVTVPLALFNLGFMTTSLCGYNAYRLDLQWAAEQTARITAPEVVLLNAQLPPGSKVLCVGEAELFDARFDYVYNTVFDVSLFEEWCGVADPNVKSADRPLKPPFEVKQILKQHGITHVFVNWQEILRYRLTYGYTDFVSPRRIQQLKQAGLLDVGWSVPGGQALLDMDIKQQTEINNWAPELIERDAGIPRFRTFDVYPVVR